MSVWIQQTWKWEWGECEGHESRRSLGLGLTFLKRLEFRFTTKWGYVFRHRDWMIRIEHLTYAPKWPPPSLWRYNLRDRNKTERERKWPGEPAVLLPGLARMLPFISVLHPVISLPWALLSFIPPALPSEMPSASYLPSAAPSTKSYHFFPPDSECLCIILFCSSELWFSISS